MTRPRKSRKDLALLDDEGTEYWNEILRREGLAMSSGASSRTTYVETSTIERIFEQKAGRKTAAKPQAE